jgi:hypothetical protein
VSGFDITIEATLHEHVRLKCSVCGKPLTPWEYPGKRNGTHEIAVKPCEVCLGEPRSRLAIQRERKLAADLDRNPAYREGYQQALDWVLDPSIPHMNEGL